MNEVNVFDVEDPVVLFYVKYGHFHSQQIYMGVFTELGDIQSIYTKGYDDNQWTRRHSIWLKNPWGDKLSFYGSFKTIDEFVERHFVELL